MGQNQIDNALSHPAIPLVDQLTSEVLVNVPSRLGVGVSVGVGVGVGVGGDAGGSRCRQGRLQWRHL